MAENLSLEETMRELNKKFGENSIMMAGKLPSMRKIEIGEPMFDYATDGGMPINRTLELYGPYSSLKSWFTLKIIAAFQKYDWANKVPNVISDVTVKYKKGSLIPEIEKVHLRRGYRPKLTPETRYCVLLDTEGSFDPAYAAKLGVNIEMLIHIRPDSLNQGIDMAETFMRNPLVCLLVVDSMIATGSDGEIDKSMEDDQMAVNARFWSKAARKFKAAMNDNKEVSLVAVNGYYDKVGLVFGNPEKVKNGNQWGLLKDISLRLFPHKETKEKDATGEEVVTGRFITIDNKKNKCGKPFLKGEFFYSFIDDDYYKACHSDYVQQLIDLAFKFGILSKKGAWITYKKVSVSGMENFKIALIKQDAVEELKEDVYANIGKV